MPNAFDRSRLSRLHDVMTRHVEHGGVHGLITLVSRRGEVHVDVLGTTTPGGSEQMSRDAIFRISSLTKPITAAAAMVLVEECVLGLDEPVDRLLPELADRRVLRRLDGPLDDTVPANRPITVRDLLTFRLGLGVALVPPDAYPILRAVRDQHLGFGPPNPDTMPAPDEWMRRLGALPLMYQPGEQWAYNSGTDVLGVLIARASGQSFETFLRDRVLEPLGMKDTGFSVPSSQLHRLLPSYSTDFATGQLVLYDPAAGGQWSHPPAFPSGSAGLVSTIDDYFAFADMLLHHGKRGGARVLSRASVELMTSDQLTGAQKAASAWLPGYFDNHGWGFGMSVVTRRDEIWEPVGQYGWDGGLGSPWRSDPHEELIMLLMTQRAWTSPVPPAVCKDFWTSVYSAID